MSLKAFFPFNSTFKDHFNMLVDCKDGFQLDLKTLQRCFLCYFPIKL